MSMLLGYDMGTSGIKATLLDAEAGTAVASARAPVEGEMTIDAPRPGWAEQSPEDWWTHVQAATAALREEAEFDPEAVAAIGLTYQMHGLVLVDENHDVLRPAIIWADSRAVGLGREAFEALGTDWCLRHLLNSPGNFTASKLAWVKRNEPEIYDQAYRAMLPGDYIALRMTGQIRTTPSGLSEATLWDVREEGLATDVLGYFDISPDLWPDPVPTFSEQGRLTTGAADTLGVAPGTPIAYRAGDQPNNAFSLGVMAPGEVAATAGTSGVIYGVGEEPHVDPQSRVNPFLHVNHAPDGPSRYGTLMCVNGTGILNRWLHDTLGAQGDLSYEQMDEEADSAPVGAEGLTVLPFGNGAERTLGDRTPGASVHGLSFTVHDRSHLLRAAQEGIVFALRYGLGIMRDMGLSTDTIRAAHGNMFLSPVFQEAFATVTETPVELVGTDGAEGAARGAGLGTGLYATSAEAFEGLETAETVAPRTDLASDYADAYQRWTHLLNNQLNRLS